MSEHFIFILAYLMILVDSQDQSGFISIDCGLQANSGYTDSTTTLNYISDEPFVHSGIIKNIAPSLSTNNLDRQFLYVRSFPEGERNCYNVSLTKGSKYLIRSSFLYGNYDGLSQFPVFDLYLGPNKWVTVQIVNASAPVDKEIIHTPVLDYIHVCLVNIRTGTPFISVLEIRPLKITTYSPQSGALVKYTRFDFGSVTEKTVRFPDDVYDRLWRPNHFEKWTDISTIETIDAESHIDFQPPRVAMGTASIPTNASDLMLFSIDSPDTSLEFYVFMHFAEIVKRDLNQSRQFNVFLDGKLYHGPVTPDYLYTITVFSQVSISGNSTFALFKTENSTLPPLLNAIEIYSVVHLLQLETDQDDVYAITNLKSTYRIKKNWQGDPCAPLVCVWHGLNCSYGTNAAPIITSLNLSSSGLTGEIFSDIANLKSLESLDLSNNSLSGSVPDFLSKMSSLKTLILTKNKLTGVIPVDLQERSKNGSLLLSVSGNEELCLTAPCKQKGKSIVVPVVASIAAFIVLGAALAVILRYSMRRYLSVDTVGQKISKEMNELMEAKNLQFSYHEILRITNNFAKVLGKGGFGTVYHGKLNDGTEVAVKILSQSSAQGYKEFHAEVKLLLKVHHRNLTMLLGYCNEGTKMGLIYEYMANGTLDDHLSDSNSNILSWDVRLQIAVDAAQGLEYLHNGCKPQMVHRDVKTTNILLNDKFQAKLADFGLSRMFPVDGGTHVSTVVAGTPGYLDPEYYVTNRLSEKSDVYSYGVVLLEIITGRSVIIKTDSGDERIHISQFVNDMVENGDIESILDPRVVAGKVNVDVNSVWKVVELAMACLSKSAGQRPTMNQLVTQLNQCLNTNLEGFSVECMDTETPLINETWT
ncbi:Leucine-rich repeat protein kinase family protein [Euphorbia peplus]|nr:Leucine-rich repeat protein kinase family protein [Euphorbia peplus]